MNGVDVDFIGNSNSGINVSETRAMQTSAVYACVKILAETVASLPLHLYKKGKNGKNTFAEQHPLYGCLYETPNEEMTSFEFRETMMTSLLLWGNAYARIIRKQGHVTELWYLKPQNMTVERDGATGKIKYTYTDDVTNETFVYKPNQVFHIKGLSYDGVTGISPIGQAREAVGLALATEEYGAKFFGNGARPGGVLEHPGTLKDPERLRESWNKVYQGTRNSHKVAVLEEGMKYHTIGIAPEDAQFLETRKYQVNEICRIFRVPPHLVGDLERATFSNIEHQSIEFVQHTMSIGFVVEEDEWSSEEGIDTRELNKVQLFDVSPVTFPAYTATDVGVRAMQEYDGYKQEQRSKEQAAETAAKRAREKAKLNGLKTKFRNI